MVLDFIKVCRKGMCMENTVGQSQINGQAQTVQVPNYSGVNIQIFNPSVAAPGASLPPSTVNAPNYSTCPCPSYPGNYYTQNFAQPAPVQAIQPVQQNQETGNTKTAKKEIVVLTDDYVKNLESYLNSQNKDDRLIGAKEVYERLHEDKSRKNDAALNALINKMLQDPYQPVRILALGALSDRVAQGNDTSVKLLKAMQSKDTKDKYDKEDAISASDALLKMSGSTTEKEFEVENSQNRPNYRQGK